MQIVTVHETIQIDLGKDGKDVSLSTFRPVIRAKTEKKNPSIRRMLRTEPRGLAENIL